jgi:hypothetical protein
LGASIPEGLLSYSQRNVVTRTLAASAAGSAASRNVNETNARRNKKEGLKFIPAGSMTTTSAPGKT